MQEDMRLTLPATEGFADPRAASSREVRTAVIALQRALGVGEDGNVGTATMQAIKRISAVPEKEAEPVEVCLVLEETVDALGQRTRPEVRFSAEPGKTFVIRAEDWIPKEKPASTLRERLNEIIDQRRAHQGDVPHQPTVPPPAKVMPADMLPVSSVAPVIDLKPAGPVYTVALVDGRMTVFRDGEPAPDSPWQLVMDAHHAKPPENRVKDAIRAFWGALYGGDGSDAYEDQPRQRFDREESLAAMRAAILAYESQG